MVDLEVKYYDAKHPGSFSGAEKLYKSQSSATRKEVKTFLKKQEPYTLHFPVRHRFPRNKVVVSGKNQMWDVDLLSMQNLADENSGYNYILCAVDILSHYARCKKLRTKTGAEVASAFKEILDEAAGEDERVQQVRSDMGAEFTGAKWRRLMASYNVKHFTTRNTEIKANYCERFFKTLKKRMYRAMVHRKSGKWADLLDDLVGSYNASYHSTIKMAPVEVTTGQMEELAWRNQYESGKPPHVDGDFKMKVGDLVRLSYVAKAFRREFHQGWTQEVFRITARRKRGGLNVYTISDVMGEAVEGSMYEPEVEAVTVDLSGVFDVDHVVRTRRYKGKKQYLVRWVGYGSKFDSWLDNSQFVPRK